MKRNPSSKDQQDRWFMMLEKQKKQSREDRQRYKNNDNSKTDCFVVSFTAAMDGNVPGNPK